MVVCKCDLGPVFKAKVVNVFMKGSFREKTGQIKTIQNE